MQERLPNQVNHDECAGKVVKSFVLNIDWSQMIVTFEDDTFAAFSAGIDGYEATPEIDADNFSLFDFGDKCLISAGVVSEEDLAKMRDDRQKSLDEIKKERERGLYEKLKEKYAPEAP